MNESLKFDDLKLLPGTKLDLRSEQYALLKGSSVFIGYHNKKAIIVSTPLSSGRPVSCSAGNPIVIRLFVNHLNCACAFRSKILHTSIVPFPHLFIEIPEAMEVGEVRNSVRANVHLISRAKSQMLSDTQSVVINNLSADGARVQSKMYLGDDGDAISLSTKVSVLDSDHIIRMKGVIRLGSDPVNKDFYGVQFTELSDSTQLIIYAFVMSEIAAGSCAM